MQGLPGGVGFKAADAQGRGVAGTVADGRGAPVATFQALKAGMGSFRFTPAPGATYTATVRRPGGQILGPAVYHGVVSCTTYRGDLGGFPLNPRALIEEYEGLQVPREFYAPRYDTDAQQRSRLPDLRNLLYWNPDVRLAARQPQELPFFTSDQAGRYLVVVQALAPNGQTGSTSFTFDVKPAL